MLELQAVHTHDGLSHVLQGISFSLGQGEVLGLFGRNGVGKTTVMKTIAGWVPASQGSVRLEGMDLAGQGSDRICRRGVGFVPEDRRIFPGLTVEENLRLGFNQVPGRARAAARAKLEAGAKLVQIYSGLIYRGPALVREAVEETKDFV